MSLRARLSTYWCAFQEHLFPTIEQDLGPLGERYQSFITVLELVRVEQHLPCCRSLRGRPQQDRAALARAFIAKAVFQIDTTRALRERLANDRALRRLCGWESIRALPSEATFSRAFAEFAEGALPSRLHEALITDTMQDQLVGHVSRDATAIEGREKATPKPQQPAKPKRKRGRPRKGEERPKEPSRLERQQEMTLTEMLDDLPPELCCRHQAQRQGLSGILDRLQAAYRRGRRWDSAQLYLDLGLGKRQPSRDSASHHDSGAGHQPVRPDGRGL